MKICDVRTLELCIVALVLDARDTDIPCQEYRDEVEVKDRRKLLSACTCSYANVGSVECE